MSSALSSERTFPYDALDQILSYACDGSKERALALGKTCRYWLSRFHGAEALWSTIAKSETTIMIPRSLRTYEGVRSAYTKAAGMPKLADTLHPIEECTMEFVCPMYTENLQYVGPDELFCEGCKKSVYLVRSQQQLDERASKGHCVMMRKSDFLVEPENHSVTRIAVVFADPSLIATGMQRIGAGATSQRDNFIRTPSLFPVFSIRKAHDASECFEFHALTIPEAEAAPKMKYSFLVLADFEDFSKLKAPNLQILDPSKMVNVMAGTAHHVVPKVAAMFAKRPMRMGSRRLPAVKAALPPGPKAAAPAPALVKTSAPARAVGPKTIAKKG